MSKVGDYFRDKIGNAATLQEVKAVVEDYKSKMSDKEQQVTLDEAVVALAGYFKATFPQRKSAVLGWAHNLRKKWQTNQSAKKLFGEKSDQP